MPWVVRKPNKLELGADLVFAWARTNVDVSGGSYVALPAGLGSPNKVFIGASNFPTVKTDTIELKLNGKYTINKVSSVRLDYSFQHMKATDYAYDGMQLGSITSVMPTLEKAPSYNVHTIGAVYIYSF